MSAFAKHEASRRSYYVTDALYSELMAEFTDWQTDGRAIGDPAERDLFRGLIEREARVLDQLRYEEWLELFTPECIYWVPATPDGGDPRREVAVMFDDRRPPRRPTSSVFAPGTRGRRPRRPEPRGLSPTSRFSLALPIEQRMVRSSFVISEFWDGEIRVLAGWSGHRIPRKIDERLADLGQAGQSV